MSKGVNKAILIGHLGNDPELRYTAGGTPVANFRIATTDAWTDKQGQKQERTEWHRIVVWSKLAELCGEYLSKGRQIYLEGRLQTRQWDDKDGNRRYTTEVVAETITFLGSGKSQSKQTLSNEEEAPEANLDQGQQQSLSYGPPPMDDDCPF